MHWLVDKTKQKYLNNFSDSSFAKRRNSYTFELEDG